jgi:hypothetical protein
MDKRYFIKRLGNNKQLTECMRRDGKFVLLFQQRESPRWADALEIVVPVTDKMEQILEHPDVVLSWIRLMPPRGSTQKIDVQLTFKGPLEAFISTKHLEQPLETPTIQEQLSDDLVPLGGQGEHSALTIDLNRRGIYAAVTNLGLEIPEEIQSIGRNWEVVEDEIGHYQHLIETSTPKRADTYKGIKAEKTRRVVNLRKDYHQRLVNWIGRQLLAIQSTILVLEDLDTNTRGTRGALAKAITQMADDFALFTRELLSLEMYTGDEYTLHTFSPYHSSSVHVGCGGKLVRDPSKEEYDIAPCQACGRYVNTHYNAALWLLVLYLHSLARPTEQELLTPRSPTCLPFLDLQRPPHVT